LQLPTFWRASVYQCFDFAINLYIYMLQCFEMIPFRYYEFSGVKLYSESNYYVIQKQGKHLEQP